MTVDLDLELRQQEVYRKLKGVIDPEIGWSIIKLGLVYDIGVNDGEVTITMTLTTQGCPLGEAIRRAVKNVVSRLDWVRSVQVNIVWEPAWTPAMIR